MLSFFCLDGNSMVTDLIRKGILLGDAFVCWVQGLCYSDRERDGTMKVESQTNKSQALLMIPCCVIT